MLTIDTVELKYTVEAWKLLNIKKSAFIQIVRIQENALFLGARRAAITKDENLKYCYHCPQNLIVTIPHILLSCVITKKRQLQSHDCICMEIYRNIIQNYCKMSDEINESVKCINTEDGTITVIFNTNVIENRVVVSIVRRPDIYLEVRGKKKGYLIDVTIVCDSKFREAYIRKVGNYYRLHERVRRDRDMRFVRVIPLVFTISGFIHKKSVKELK